jgi:hypothetical protein
MYSWNWTCKTLVHADQRQLCAIRESSAHAVECFAGSNDLSQIRTFSQPDRYLHLRPLPSPVTIICSFPIG